jgi:hypothetical protein
MFPDVYLQSFVIVILKVEISDGYRDNKIV